MTPVPPPASPCIRVRLIYNDDASNVLGNRFFFSYTGGPPTAGDLSALALAIGNAWETHVAPVQSSTYGLTEVEVLDIATNTGNSGSSVVGWDGSRSGQVLPAQVTFNMKYSIGRRYRGGKPKGYFPWGVQDDTLNQAEWTADFGATCSTAWTDFITAVKALSEGTIAVQQHVNLSYYSGFRNITNSSGRERAVPTYRAAALVDVITGYAFDQVMGSQRRRRTSTTP